MSPQLMMIGVKNDRIVDVIVFVVIVVVGCIDWQEGVTMETFGARVSGRGGVKTVD